MRGCIAGGCRVVVPLFCRLMLVVSWLIPLAATGCHRAVDSAQGVSVYQEIAPQPVRTGRITTTVRLEDAAEKPVTHAAIMVEADMAHPGMSPVFSAANEVAPGKYRADIDLNMRGDWVVLLHIRLADGRKIERQMDVKGVRAN
jgi:YtkA-like